MNKNSIILISMLALGGNLFLTGCGSGTAESQAAIQGPVGQIHEVAMRGDASGFYYEPKELTIQQGDLVRWTMVDGAPHNVNFSGQQFPSGARLMLERRGQLMGVMLHVPGQTYEIHFTEDFPAGEYNYICDPHLMLNMVGRIIVTE